MAKKNNNTVAPETTVVVSTPKLTLAEKLDNLCSGFLGGLQDIMDEAMSDTRTARDTMLDAVAVYRSKVANQDALADVILSVGNAVVNVGGRHVAEVGTYENTLGILDDLEEEITSSNNADEIDEDEIVDEDEDFYLDEDEDEIVDEEIAEGINEIDTETVGE